MSHRSIFLNPGQYAYGDERTQIKTILGSCVAVTFWHPGRRIGAMCHYLLPGRPPNSPAPPDGKYADDVIRLIADHFNQLNLHPSSLEVKMFGGSDMFPDLAKGDNLKIGTKNIYVGLKLLASIGFNIINHDLAGGTNRSVIFDIGTGEVWVRQGQAAAGSKPGRT